MGCLRAPLTGVMQLFLNLSKCWSLISTASLFLKGRSPVLYVLLKLAAVDVTTLSVLDAQLVGLLNLFLGSSILIELVFDCTSKSSYLNHLFQLRLRIVISLSGSCWCDVVFGRIGLCRNLSELSLKQRLSITCEEVFLINDRMLLWTELVCQLPFMGI